jgi:hemoglobin
MTPFDELGGEPALRAIVDEFVDRVFDDVMIGFLFHRANKERIKRHEYEHAARWLGAEVEYTGRPLDAAHAPHRILGGQFLRRKEILRQVLVAHGVSASVVDAWMDHTESLRPLITKDAGEHLSGLTTLAVDIAPEHRAIHTRSVHKTTLVIDQAKLRRVRKVLGTKGIRDTVDRALDEVLALEARRRLVEKLRTMDGLDLDDAKVMAGAWR